MFSERVEHFAHSLGWGVQNVVALQGDVSNRLYFRLISEAKTWIVCHYREDLWPMAERFTTTTTILADAGIRVPEVFAVDPVERLILLEDFGQTPWYAPGATYQTRDQANFVLATEIAAQVQHIELPRESSLLPPLDASVLAQELENTLRYLPFSDQNSSASLTSLLETICGQIIDAISEIPLSPAHRDFMVRNLIPLEDETLGVIDHQDLRPAPRGYDFVSLMNDSLFPPHPVVDSLRRQAFPDLDRITYHALAAQRTLKAAGSYARATSEGNCSHQILITPTLRRFVDHLEAIQETHHHAAELRTRWLAELSL